MAVTQYVGARYVPLFADPLDWDNTREYEPLTIVYNAGNSYTSRQYVPTGIDISNDDYWALTGNYNAQIEQYRQEVRAFDERITNAQNAADAAQSEAESKAPVPHASPDTTYGIGDATNYGHVKLTDTPSESGASAGVAASPAMVNAVKETIDNEVTSQLEELQNDVSELVNTKAPINHASTATTYGVGTGTNYGHVKLTDTMGTSGISDGIAATPALVNLLKEDTATNLDALRLVNMLTLTPGDSVEAVSSNLGYCWLFKNLGIMLLKAHFTTTSAITASDTVLFNIGATMEANRQIYWPATYFVDGNRYVHNLYVDTNGDVRDYSSLAAARTVLIDTVVNIASWGGDYAPDLSGAN